MMHAAARAAVGRVRDATHWFECSNFKSSDWDSTDIRTCTRLTIGIWVCGKIALSCIVIYDAGDISFPPDLIIQGCHVRLSDIKPLVEWKADDESNLLQTLLSVRRTFIEEQRQRFLGSNVERISFEMGCIDHIQGLELLLERSDTSRNVIYHIYVPVPYHEKPVCPGHSEPSNNAVIHFAYTVNESNRKLESATREFLVVKNMKTDPAVKLPKCGLDVLIVDYITQVQDILSSMQNTYLKDLSAREILVRCLATEFSEFILEYDDVNFTYFGMCIYINPVSEEQQMAKISCGAIVNIHIPETYPAEQFRIILSSPTLFQSDGSHLPESREWLLSHIRGMTPEDAVAAIKSSVAEQILKWTGSVLK
ncbi:hypothetical protein BASA50_002775 [Batrachochytrium salamandrivorans]|uniref:BRISC and BRCA1-A complex member 2 n=1 Tax=Batrachochytrium salamandrivorans TaxID=1357716 RepID=A0ABQ8FKQ2_9FUNG|nr:hypothetical protein BASA62_004216 [Batrachochytrium salamandrivorans]KAH6580577.1 hypothetical protein BASA61_009589 [Batrachochytrium salamandrivorans]KAH6582758.1 hypothetical protein BASA60_001770 [Batrachochytrium salamandrivorans]KAH6599750.1 hypothetical protein BASA50_002775 [Batrachochytrium salamandrivorans]KAH9274075.1 hypothetical protein BASA83_003717 [Batrachochytrium salamandrivorans]